MVSKIWQFLTTDITELNWKQATAVVKTGAEASKAVLDLAKTVNEKKGDLEKAKSAIAPYVNEMSSLLDALNSPIAAVVKDAIPFAPISVTILQLICDATKRGADAGAMCRLDESGSLFGEFAEMCFEPQRERLCCRI